MAERFTTICIDTSLGKDHRQLASKRHPALQRAVDGSRQKKALVQDLHHAHYRPLPANATQRFGWGARDLDPAAVYPSLRGSGLRTEWRLESQCNNINRPNTSMSD